MLNPNNNSKISSIWHASPINFTRTTTGLALIISKRVTILLYMGIYMKSIHRENIFTDWCGSCIILEMTGGIYTRMCLH